MPELPPHSGGKRQPLESWQPAAAVHPRREMRRTFLTRSKTPPYLRTRSDLAAGRGNAIIRVGC